MLKANDDPGFAQARKMMFSKSLAVIAWVQPLNLKSTLNSLYLCVCYCQSRSSCYGGSENPPVVLPCQYRMEAEDCTKCSRCNEPVSVTAEDWNHCGDRIKDLYLNQGWHLPQIRQEMHKYYDFHCKERQYKTKFKKDPAYGSKRLLGDQYEAMAVVAKAQPQTINFRALRGGRQVDISLPQIHKELMRRRKRRSRDPPSRVHEMALDKAIEILNTARIQVISGSGVVSLQDDSRLLPFFETPASRSGSDSSCGVATPTGTPASLNESTSAFSRHSSYNFGRGPYTVDHGDGIQLSTHGMGILMKQQTLSEPLDPLVYLYMNSADDGRASLDASVGGNPFERGLPRPRAPENEEKQRTLRWAQPFYMGCFSAAKYALHDLTELKADAIKSLRTILLVNPENKHVFPCLNEVVTVLSMNEKWVQLEEFLRQSIGVIEENSPLATPFRYALAACIDDSDAKNHYGSMLQQTHNYMVPRCGLKHPNLLVNSYYWAWHQMDNGKHGQVINLLRDRLAEAQNLLDGQKWDGHNLMIVNCLVMLGRAYFETNQHQKACNSYERALGHLYGHSYLQAYHLMILLRLAQSQVALGDMALAELHVKQVVHGRIAILGYSSQSTSSAIDDYYNLLQCMQQKQKADEMYMYHTQVCERLQDRQWYAERRLDIPKTLLDPTGAVTGTWSAPIPMRPQHTPLQHRM